MIVSFKLFLYGILNNLIGHTGWALREAIKYSQYVHCLVPLLINCFTSHKISLRKIINLGKVYWRRSEIKEMKINKYISVSESIATFVTLQHLQDKDRDGLISYDEFCDKKTKTEIAFEVILLFTRHCDKLTNKIPEENIYTNIFQIIKYKWMYETVY